LQKPSPRLHEAADQVISYLAVEFSAEVADSSVFACASDATFADDKATRHSSDGYLLTLFGGAIDWHSIKQKTVTTYLWASNSHACCGGDRLVESIFRRYSLGSLSIDEAFTSSEAGDFLQAARSSG
jgi:hypothetical protein